MPLLDNLVTNATCESCHWWWGDFKGLGECHYNAPTVSRTPEECWPQTAAHEYCSKWERNMRPESAA